MFDVYICKEREREREERKKREIERERGSKRKWKRASEWVREGVCKKLRKQIVKNKHKNEIEAASE